MKLIILYMSLINMIGFFIMGIDKYKAKYHRWRISEKFIFAVCLVGGSLGTWVGMYFFHHKTRHWYFIVGIPFLLFIQILLFIYLYRY